ncbi:XRE family transcriptional regulator [Pseudomonas sp. TH39(2020)]|uniref:XRE family transcriptional regulator n=1 Tax=Pseudomonas sp. TH39(2020) TaxID=2796349 RepID=UPI0019118AE6|nr:XRE family transcriptional regulator [Pseudomonas sp. TH39(2020)]MBK5397125.1 XRE family transcriptional regulator [Pseudomonas sp. TH39(2020)]
MSEVNGNDSCVYEALGHPDAGEMRGKSEYVMKIGLLLETGRLSKTEAAQKLGLSKEELNEMLRGKFRDLTVAKISEYLNLLQDQRS